MAKIVSVRVWGFQSHLDTRYDVHPGLNVFTGPSGAGKTSATVRALRWLVLGEPQGEAFLHTVYDTDGKTVLRQAYEAGVEVLLDNGVTVRKTRAKGKTKYWVHPRYDEPFEKAEVPEAVREALGIRETSFGDFETVLNFAYQLANPFLLSEPGSAGAKVLGKLAGTEAVDGAIKLTSKETHAARTDKAAADKEYERKVSQLVEYEDIETVQAELDACGVLLENVQEQLTRKTDLETNRTKLEVVETILSQLDLELCRLSVLPALEEDLQNIEKAQQRNDRLLDLFTKLSEATATVDTLTKLLESYQGLDNAVYWLEEATANFALSENLVRLVKEYHITEATVKQAQAVIDGTADLDILEQNVMESHFNLNLLDKWKNGLAAHKQAAAEIARYQAILDSMAGAEAAAEMIPALETAVSRLASLQETYRLYQIKTATVERADQEAAAAAKALEEAEAELSAAWAAAGDVCPLCESVIAHSH